MKAPGLPQDLRAALPGAPVPACPPGAPGGGLQGPGLSGRRTGCPGPAALGKPVKPVWQRRQGPGPGRGCESAAPGWANAGEAASEVSQQEAQGRQHWAGLGAGVPRPLPLGAGRRLPAAPSQATGCRGPEAGSPPPAPSRRPPGRGNGSLIHRAPQASLCPGAAGPVGGQRGLLRWSVGPDAAPGRGPGASAALDPGRGGGGAGARPGQDGTRCCRSRDLAAGSRSSRLSVSLPVWPTRPVARKVLRPVSAR